MFQRLTPAESAILGIADMIDDPGEYGIRWTDYLYDRDLLRRFLRRPLLSETQQRTVHIAFVQTVVDIIGRIRGSRDADEGVVWSRSTSTEVPVPGEVRRILPLLVVYARLFHRGVMHGQPVPNPDAAAQVPIDLAATLVPPEQQLRGLWFLFGRALMTYLYDLLWMAPPASSNL